jgi:muramoyltetrapeptide carboxypeptidase LdcA involved in peptidoglycan recycling
MLKPKMLRSGDTIAVVSLSSGDAHSFPQRYARGKALFEEEFGVHVVEMPNALRDEEWIGQNPQGRAEDLMAAFADDTISGIITASGGDDSIRLLPYFDLDVIRAHPKVFLGHSDTTATHFACHKAGLVSFYGPSLMTSLAEPGGLFPYMVQSMRSNLFSAAPIGLLEPNTQGWTREEVDYEDEEAHEKRRKMHTSEPWLWHQGEGVVQGRLLGGCLEIVELLRGTSLWPDPQAWQGAILFLETSDETPPPDALLRALRVYAQMGILEQLSGILLGRPGGLMPTEEFESYEQAVLKVVVGEEGLSQLPIISRLDFGHTDPTLTIPLGLLAEIDCSQQKVTILESAVEA